MNSWSLLRRDKKNRSGKLKNSQIVREKLANLECSCTVTLELKIKVHFFLSPFRKISIQPLLLPFLIEILKGLVHDPRLNQSK